MVLSVSSKRGRVTVARVYVGYVYNVRLLAVEMERDCGPDI